ncbi:metal ABC transporter solute-binding protein, Zn/Mn family [Cyanobium sp. ATX 6F1]|uniref:metal ABC transporter solute-binding protein, Zn/Mn family n=1 Tax=unclassified Cyanobium TaxID=2627006 RepID=UPI0020CC6A11|nr:zinc ABC transporter substrate-binding protein [Cyanobium sp. ATX 6F1]MCP9915727.1 zinc ABC transporter substrate-binding protein [Cyanobium sp. ATX 6F1]
MPHLSRTPQAPPQAWIRARARFIAGLLATASLLAGCQPKATASKTEKPLAVVTTFLPITEFTRAVAGDCATVNALIPTKVGPHDFQATPTDLARLRQADVLVKNGLGLEGFLDKLIAGAENPRLRVIDTSQGISTLSLPGAGGGHHHGADQIEAKGHDHGEINPHIWLDPLRAAQQVTSIRDGLIAARPACKATFTTNAARFTAELERLNTDLAAQLKPYAGKTFVAFHDFAPYFAERYGLKASFVVNVPEENPTPADLRRVARLAQATQLKALLSEPQEGSGSFQALANDLGVKVIAFDSLETGPDSAAAPGTYARTLRGNAANLVKALGG